VPYSVNVNVGKLLPNSYFADSWPYQSREANFNTVTTYPVAGTSVNGPYWEVYTGGSLDDDDCEGYMNNDNFDGWGGFSPTDTTTGGPAPTATVVTTFPDDGNASGGTNGEWGWTGAPDTSGDYRSCRRLRTDTTTTYGAGVDTQVFSDWTYKQVTWPISGLKAGGSSWNASVNIPIGSNGVNTTVPWDGCIEERETVRNTDGDPSDEWSPIPSGAYDMNIDLVPTSGTASSLWGPLLPGAVWGRYTGSGWSTSNTTATVTTASDLNRNYSYYCPAEAKKLTIYATASPFETYVNSLYDTGNTYHDIGLLWGARFLSPTGLFASENAFTPSGGQIQRHMIFMTDGDTNTNDENYSAYGVHWWDRRQTSTSSAPSDGTTGLLAQVIDARTAALCTAIKNMNITLWVISFGEDVASATQTRLSNCASPGKFYNATNTATLIANFQQIADKIAELRLTQ
jgi:hypothetical protein